MQEFPDSIRSFHCDLSFLALQARWIIVTFFSNLNIKNIQQAGKILTSLLDFLNIDKHWTTSLGLGLKKGFFIVDTRPLSTKIQQNIMVNHFTAWCNYWKKNIIWYCKDKMSRFDESYTFCSPISDLWHELFFFTTLLLKTHRCVYNLAFYNIVHFKIKGIHFNICMLADVTKSNSSSSYILF